MTKRAVLPCLDAAGSCRFGLTDEQYESMFGESSDPA
ncbi:hypothetical protein GGP66_003520 [Salinibacter ruber]|nr:hypothetical protein [Salinibacter ruber]MCS3676064.1 hypothetical protein [Salinibacter ruber]MCS3785763.1 hypothetical protein [Salinibacter ruber]